jgi:hypothetical protein
VYRRILTLSLCSLLAACAGTKPTVAVVTPAVEEVPVWRATIKPQDNARLDTLPGSWASLIDRLPRRVRARQSEVVDPAAGLDHPALTPGSYRCRVLRLRAATRAATVRSSTSDFCHVSATDEGFAFVKQTGGYPAAGYLYPDGKRYVFLGARQRRSGDNSLGYGTDPARDLVGVAERVGGFRWRLAVPGAGPDQVEIYELTPVPAEQQPQS